MEQNLSKNESILDASWLLQVELQQSLQLFIDNTI